MMDSVNLDLSSLINLTDEQFFQLCQEHELVNFERNADRTMVLMPLVGALTSNINGNITYQLGTWNKNYKLGIVFGSDVGFTLPNGAVRSPDAAWIKQEKWEALNQNEREKFAPLSPDFIIELQSKQHKLSRLQAKMREYLENGTSLGWLIDLETKKVEIYRQGKDLAILDNPKTLSGEDILPDFILDLTSIW
ncbi:Uma2 family endonuclease [Crocosphaera sp. UHCC 0190]|uniref:Uma2 family endonuclease n=1 Tax=Crocosphaera sp. UHCC 0190 TaxID=3110246 RepID=UPI002B1F51FF|nr:Uma2 family endonuclease [Crocosphaera sp. UHCC 0190]MEA5510603.1 Uma2 family endonuclease [Crocosphaera sp. UHCC 0190]